MNTDFQHVLLKNPSNLDHLFPLYCVSWCFKLIPNWRCFCPLLQTRPWALHCWTNWTVAFVMAWAMQSIWVKTKSWSRDIELIHMSQACVCKYGWDDEQHFALRKWPTQFLNNFNALTEGIIRENRTVLPISITVFVPHLLYVFPADWNSEFGIMGGWAISTLN